MLKKFCAIVILFIQCVNALKIISDEVKGKFPCISQCVGLIKPNWDISTAFIEAKVDISECGFVSRPVVTVATEDNVSYQVAAGNIWSVKNTLFVYYLPNKNNWDSINWKLAWTATGYVC